MTGPAPLPPPQPLDRRPRDLLGELCTHLPSETVAGLCADLVMGADPQPWLLPWLAGVPGSRYPAPGWDDWWPRVWGARGLLHVWSDDAAGAVTAGVRDPAWRVAEMCLKVARRHQLPVADAAALLADHSLTRVRVAALRALEVSGDHEHVAVVRQLEGDPDEPAEVRRAAATALDSLLERLDVQPADHG